MPTYPRVFDIRCSEANMTLKEDVQNDEEEERMGGSIGSIAMAASFDRFHHKAYAHVRSGQPVSSKTSPVASLLPTFVSEYVALLHFPVFGVSLLTAFWVARSNGRWNFFSSSSFFSQRYLFEALVFFSRSLWGLVTERKREEGSHGAFNVMPGVARSLACRKMHTVLRPQVDLTQPTSSAKEAASSAGLQQVHLYMLL